MAYEHYKPVPNDFTTCSDMHSLSLMLSIELLQDELTVN